MFSMARARTSHLNPALGTILFVCWNIQGRCLFEPTNEGDPNMNISLAAANGILTRTLHVLNTGDRSLLAALDELPAAIYVTDAEGVITYYNPACIAFAGRVPALGQDRWCVTWKLYTEDGAFLPHDKCPMADAILTQTPVRGVSAVAERPDGTRLNFVPFPTPLFDAQGRFIGAVNMLIDVTASKRATVLREQARRCRRLAISVDDEQTTSALNGLAAGYEEEARKLSPN
jgi:PAS domain-containing protein